MDNSLLKWLQNWFFQNCDNKLGKEIIIFLRNIDNPGWALTFFLEKTIYIKRNFKEIFIDRTEHDWCHCLIENNNFECPGGPFNLNEILNCFKNFVEDKQEIYNPNFEESEIINWMQRWYYDQCDEDWEHSERFIIKTTENGWHFSFFLEDTPCQNKLFDPIEVKKSEHDWYKCFLSQHRFEGIGGAFNLIDIINVFRNWVEELTM